MAIFMVAYYIKVDSKQVEASLITIEELGEAFQSFHIVVEERKGSPDKWTSLGSSMLPALGY